MKIEIGIPVLDSADKDKKVSAVLTCTDISAKGAISIKMVDLLPYLTNKIAVDLFFISSFVYGVDRFIDRYSYSEDGWSRALKVTFPVYELKK